MRMSAIPEILQLPGMPPHREQARSHRDFCFAFDNDHCGSGLARYGAGQTTKILKDS
jgi:hypothetical protein